MPTLAGFCASCYRQRRHSARYFAGVRDQVLLREGYRCQGCGAGNQWPGIHDAKWLVTLCPACHAVVHKLLAHRRWLPDPLLALWREQHPALPLQLQFAINLPSAGDRRGGEAATS